MKKVSNTIILMLIIAFSFQSFAGTKSAISTKIILKENWKVLQNKKVSGDGSSISSIENNSKNWYNASVPSTVMGVLTTNGLYKDIFVGDN